MKKSKKISLLGILIALVGVIALLITKLNGPVFLESLHPLIFIGVIAFVFGRFLD